MTMVRSWTSRAAALTAALLLSAGCATKRDVRDLTTELRALAARQDSILVALQRQNLATQDTLRRQTSQLFEVRGDVARQLQLILDELSGLRELTGQNQRAIASIRDQLEGMRRYTPSAEQTPGGGEAIVPGGGPGSGDPRAGDEAYRIAKEMHGRGNLATARTAYEDFILTYPNHPSVPEARLFLAEVVQEQDGPEAALQAYNQIPELHPTSPVVPDALLRMAKLEIERDNRDEARRLLDRVVNSYPESVAAAEAREALRELR
jgi:tol-pal system protein YbgF